MCARITALCAISLLAMACSGGQGNNSADGENRVDTDNQPTRLSFRMVELKRQGGANCPDDTTGGTDNSSSAADADYLCATVKLSYPEILSESNPDLAAKINAFIHDQMIDNPEGGGGSSVLTLAQFAERFIDDYKQDPNPFASWELERNISTVFTTSTLLTLSVGEYGYTGGAHPYSGQRYSVLSLENGERVMLADLLTSGYEVPLNVAGERVFRAERELSEADDLEEQGFSFENNVFHLNKNFGVLKEGLGFVFNSYEIAPYAMGPTQFIIPYEDIQALIDQSGLLGRSEQ